MMNKYKNVTALAVDLLAIEDDIKSLCNKISETNLVNGAALLPLYIKTAHEVLHSRHIELIAMVGYPSGHAAIEAKLSEMVLALVDGATAIQFVMNHIAIRNNDWKYVANELSHLQLVATNKKIKLQAHLIPSLLTNEMISRCSDLLGLAGLDALVLNIDDLSEEDAIRVLQLIRLQLASHVKLGVSAHSKTINFTEHIVKSDVDFFQTSNYEQLLQQFQNA